MSVHKHVHGHEQPIILHTACRVSSKFSSTCTPPQQSSNVLQLEPTQWYMQSNINMQTFESFYNVYILGKMHTFILPLHQTANWRVTSSIFALYMSKAGHTIYIENDSIYIIWVNENIFIHFEH